MGSLFWSIATSHILHNFHMILSKTYLFSNCFGATEERATHATISVHFALAWLLVTRRHGCLLRAVRGGQVWVVAIASVDILLLLFNHVNILTRLNFLQIERTELQLYFRGVSLRPRTHTDVEIQLLNFEVLYLGLLLNSARAVRAHLLDLQLVAHLAARE